MASGSSSSISSDSTGIARLSMASKTLTCEASSNPTTPPLDLSKYYYRAKLHIPHSIVCLIPLNLLPPEKTQEALNGGLCKKDPAIMQMPMKERLTYLTKEFKQPIWIVEPPKRPTDPWTIKRLHTLRNKKVTVLDCAEEFKRAGNGKTLREAMWEGQAAVTVTPTQTDASLKMRGASLIIKQVPVDQTGQRFLSTDPLFQQTALEFLKFKQLIGQLVSRYGSQLCPSESICLLWDSISQSIVYHHPIDERQRIDLSKRLLEYWQDIQWWINLFMEGCLLNKDEQIKTGATRLVEQLKNIKAFLFPSADGRDEHLCSKLKKVTAPLHALFDYSLALFSNTRHLSLFQQEFLKINVGTLRDLGDVSIEMRSQPEALKQWLQFRIDTLSHYLQASPQVHPVEQTIIQGCQEIQSFFNNRQWVMAYETMKRLDSETTSFHALVTSKIAYKETEITVASSINSRENFKVLREIHFIRALIRDFEFCISQGKLFSIVSREANREMIDSYKDISIRVPQQPQIPLNKWLKQLAQFEGDQLRDELSQFRASWQSLREIKKGLMNDSILCALLQQLHTLIATESYTEVHTHYLEIAGHLKVPIKIWEERLKQISSLIKTIQLTCLVLLYHPKAPPVTAEILQEGFSQFNQQLLKIVQPVTQFFNAFQQLISMGMPSALSSGSSSSSPELLFTEEGSFTLSLFPEDADYFDQLREELAYLRPQEEQPVEIIPVATTSSSTSTDPVEEIFASLKGIFRATKTDKIETEITALLNELHIEYWKEAGKGSHTKLYIKGINRPIILPVHTEWKPGTKKSIENSLLEQLRTLLTQQTGSSSSSK